MKEIICGIYRVVSPSGKIYVGQSKNIYKRWEDYRKHSCKNQSRLYNSLKKYEHSKHLFEIVEQCRIEDLNNRERYWQNYYRVTDRSAGMNCLLTASNSETFIMSDSTKDKIRESLKMYRSKNARSIYQYSLDGVLINKWSSISELESCLTFDRRYIFMCCRKKHYKAYEYIWSYSEETFSNEYLEKARCTKSDKLRGHTFNLGKVHPESTRRKIGNKSRGRKHSDSAKKIISESKQKEIKQMDKDGNYLRQWRSATEAAKQLGLFSQNISYCCLGKLKTAGGFKWEFIK